MLAFSELLLVEPCKGIKLETEEELNSFGALTCKKRRDVTLLHSFTCPCKTTTQRSFKVFHSKCLSLDPCLWHRFWFYTECLLPKGMILLLPFQECGDFLVSARVTSISQFSGKQMLQKFFFFASTRLFIQLFCRSCMEQVELLFSCFSAAATC